MALRFLNSGYFAGKVGIGTESPDRKLHVKDSAIVVSEFEGTNTGSLLDLVNSNASQLYNGIRFTQGTSNKMAITHIADGTTKGYVQIGNSWATGSEILVVDGRTSNVGIGTTSPQSKLHIADSTLSLLKVQETSGNTGASAGALFKTSPNTGNSYFKGGILYEDTGNANVIGKLHLVNRVSADTTNAGVGDAKLTIDTNGNVGIGTTSPNALLDVSATSNATIRLSSSSANQQGQAIGKIDFYSADTSTPGAGVKSSITTYVESESSAEGDASSMAFSTSNGAVNNVERVRIDKNGNVGIGDTGPNVKLQVSTSSPTNNVAVSIGDGWVGNSSYHKEGGLLLISGTSQDATQTGAGIAFQTRNTQNTNYWKSSMIMDRDGAIRFTLGGAGTVAGSEDFTILSGGNVGIGATSPSQKLQVDGSIKVNANGFFGPGGTVTTDGIVSIDGGSGTGGEAYLRLMRGGTSGFILNHTATAIQVRATANIPMFFYTNDTIGIKLNANSTVSFPEYAAGYLKTDASGNITADNTGGGLPGGPYLPLAGGTMTGNVRLNDSVQLQLGSSNDAYIMHNGTNTYFVNSVGDLEITNDTNDGDIYFQSDNGSGGIATYFQLDGSHTQSIAWKDIHFVDGIKAKFGDYASPDLQIYHDGSNSYIDETGTGSLYNRTTLFIVQNTDSTKNSIIGNPAADVKLYYNGVKKFETTSLGVTVTGDVVIDSALLSNQENTDVDTGTETVANVAVATYTAAFFDFVIKKTTNVRSGTVYACHDGTNVEFTETSTQDLGDTSDVTLSVDISGGNMRLRATTTSDDWSVKSLIRAI